MADKCRTQPMATQTNIQTAHTDATGTHLAIHPDIQNHDTLPHRKAGHGTNIAQPRKGRQANEATAGGLEQYSPPHTHAHWGSTA